MGKLLTKSVMLSVAVLRVWSNRASHSCSVLGLPSQRVMYMRSRSVANGTAGMCFSSSGISGSCACFPRLLLLMSSHFHSLLLLFLSFSLLTSRYFSAVICFHGGTCFLRSPELSCPLGLLSSGLTKASGSSTTLFFSTVAGLFFFWALQGRVKLLARESYTASGRRLSAGVPGRRG